MNTLARKRQIHKGALNIYTMQTKIINITGWVLGRNTDILHFKHNTTMHNFLYQFNCAQRKCMITPQN